MQEKPVTEQILDLLEERKTAREIIDLGFKENTVYGVQGQWRKRQAEGAGGIEDAPKGVPDIERDSEIVDLKKQIRIKELDNKLKGLADADLERRVVRLENDLHFEKERGKSLRAQVSSIPLVGVGDQRCRSCGTPGLVAVMVTCTACGVQVPWGRFPQPMAPMPWPPMS